jgi:hypothetical protein
MNIDIAHFPHSFKFLKMYSSKIFDHRSSREKDQSTLLAYISVVSNLNVHSVLIIGEKTSDIICLIEYIWYNLKLFDVKKTLVAVALFTICHSLLKTFDEAL